MKNDLYKVYCFAVCVVYLFATVGSTASLFYNKMPQFAVATILLAAMAFPYALKCGEDLINDTK